MRNDEEQVFWLAKTVCIFLRAAILSRSTNKEQSFDHCSMSLSHHDSSASGPHQPLPADTQPVIGILKNKG